MKNDLTLCSACLLGINCRYNGKNNKSKKVLAMKEHLFPVCPEQFGGLTTPREPAGIKGNTKLTLQAASSSQT